MLNGLVTFRVWLVHLQINGGDMKYAAQCITIFFVLTILLALTGIYVLNLSMEPGGIILFSATAGLVLTLIYGWIDAVYIKKRQPGL